MAKGTSVPGGRKGDILNLGLTLWFRPTRNARG